MENKSLLEKIKSKYITEIITSYITDNNIILKLFKYSKYYHKKIKIDLSFFKENYLNKRIIWEKYLCAYDKDDLKRILLSYNLNNIILEKIVIDYFLNQLKEKDLKFEQKINIEFDSPFFDFLFKTNFFWDLFSIKFNGEHYPTENIYYKYKLYENEFKNYSLFFNHANRLCIEHIKHLHINPKRINYLEISIKDESDNKFNYWLFTNLIPSCKNLIYLSLSMYNNFYIEYLNL